MDDAMVQTGRAAYSIRQRGFDLGGLVSVGIFLYMAIVVVAGMSQDTSISYSLEMFPSFYESLIIST